jgi:exopolysaccharide biosynthesis polyprenyl glycosylphosphotransferase
MVARLIIMENDTMAQLKLEAVTRTPVATPRKSERRFALPFSERRALFIILDLFAINGALYLALYCWARYGANRWEPGGYRPLWFLLLSVVWLAVAQAFDAYNLRLAGHLHTSLLSVSKAGAISSLVYIVIPFVTPSLPASRLAFAAFPLLVVAMLVAERCFYVVALGQPIFHRRAVIVGAGWAGCTIAETLAEQGDETYELLGFVDDDPRKLGEEIRVGQRDGCAISLPVLGDRYALQELIARYHVSTLVMAITHGANGDLLPTLMDCLELGVDIIPMPVLYEQITGRVPVAHVGDSWELCMPIDHAGTRTLVPLVKRLMDLALAGVGILCLGLALLVIALAIAVDSPGPVFYSQARVGKGGWLFRVWKFRSMTVNAERDGAVWAQKSDPRVTRVGRLLRKTHLDELPQLYNILRGEMSIVGPRPERPEFVDRLAQEIPFYRVRHAVKPGAAGWALVRQGYGASTEDALLKLQYDLYYIKHQSPWLDLVILLKTAAHMVTFGGR